MDSRKKRKEQFQYLLFFLLLLFLSACSGAGGEKTDEAQKTQSAEKKEKKSRDRKDKKHKESESEEETEQNPEEDTDQEDQGASADPAFLDLVYTRDFHHLSKGENLWYYGEYPMLRVKTEGFEELQKTLDVYNRQEETQAREGMQSMMEEYPEIEIPADAYLHYTLDASVFVARADEEILSFTKRRQIFLGVYGHTEASYTGVNIEAKTGRMLEFGDIVKDIPACIEKIKEEAKPQLFYDAPEEVFEKLDRYKNRALGASDEAFSWVLDYEGIAIYLNPEWMTKIYPHKIYIPYRGNEALFNGEYFDPPQRYITQLVPDTGYILETEKGMQRFEVSHGEMTEGVMTIEIVGEDNYISELVEGFSATVWLLHTERKQNLLYYLVEGYGDSTAAYVYDLNDEEFNRIEVYYGMPIGEIFTREEGFEKSLFLDPDRFKLLTASELLGSSAVTMNCRLDEEGLIREEDPYYDILQGSGPLTLKKKLIVNSVDEQGREGQEIVLSPGESLEYFRTDRKTYVDMRTSEGGLCRIQIEYEQFDNGEEWQSIGGEPIEEYFDGLMFAD